MLKWLVETKSWTAFLLSGPEIHTSAPQHWECRRLFPSYKRGESGFQDPEAKYSLFIFIFSLISSRTAVILKVPDVVTTSLIRFLLTALGQLFFLVGLGGGI